MGWTRIGKLFHSCSVCYFSPRLSVYPQPRRISAAIFSHQMSTNAQSVAARLNSSGFIKSQGFIGGKWTDAYDGKTIEVCNPATGEVVTNVSCMGGRETNDAIAAAHDAFISWSKLTAAERSKCLRKWYDLIIAHKEELGQLMTLEQGKPLKEAIGEVSYGASFVEFYAEEAKRVYGDIIPATLPDRRLFVLKQPVGVVGAITPWNFPLAMITRKVAPALACGCTVVIKPSELTPLTALAAAELSIQAGIPPVILIFIPLKFYINTCTMLVLAFTCCPVLYFYCLLIYGKVKNVNTDNNFDDLSDNKTLQAVHKKTTASMHIRFLGS